MSKTSNIEDRFLAAAKHRDVEEIGFDSCLGRVRMWLMWPEGSDEAFKARIFETLAAIQRAPKKEVFSVTKDADGNVVTKGKLDW